MPFFLKHALSSSPRRVALSCQSAASTPRTLPTFRSTSSLHRSATTQAKSKVKKAYLKTQPKPAPKDGNKTVTSNIARSSKDLTRTNLFSGRWDPLEAKLASKKGPTVIYEGPSKKLHTVFCYTLGGFCFAYTGYHLWDLKIDPKQEVPKWIQVTMSGVCALMLTAGGYFISKTLYLARTITVLPKTLPSGQPALQLQIRTGSFFPRTSTINLNDARPSGGHLYKPPEKVLGPTEQAYERLKRKAEHYKDMERLWTKPFRDFGKAFVQFQRMVTNENVVYINVPDTWLAYKIPNPPLWALEDGKVLDSLLKH